MVSKKREKQLKMAVGILTCLGLALAPWVTFGLGQSTLLATILLSVGSLIAGLSNWANRELSDLMDKRAGIVRPSSSPYLAPVELPSNVLEPGFAGYDRHFDVTEEDRTARRRSRFESEEDFQLRLKSQVPDAKVLTQITECEALTPKLHYSKRDKKNE